MLPKVTALVTVYSKPENLSNTVKQLDEAMQSALSQDYNNLEILVIDDGTVPPFHKHIQNYNDSRINYHYMDHKGLPFGLINGMQMAQGKYVAILDHDDVLTPGSITKRVNQLEKTRKGFCYGDNELIDENSNVYGYQKAIGFENAQQFIKHYFVKPLVPFTHPSVMFNREKVLDVGNYEPHTIFDFHLLMKVAKKHGLTKVDDNVIRYRTHSTNSTNGALKRLKYIKKDYMTAKDILEPNQMIPYLGIKTLTTLAKAGYLFFSNNRGIFYQNKTIENKIESVERVNS